MKLKWRLRPKWLPSGRKAKWVELVIVIGLIVLVMLWQTGSLAGGKVKPGCTPLPGAPGGAATLVLQPVEVPEVYETVGTVRSRTEIDLAPRIVARAQEINVRSGDRVTQGEVLVKLDDADLASGVRQAAEHVRQTRAALDLATTELARTRKLLANGSVSQQAFDLAESGFLQAQAGAQGAVDAQHQAETVMGYATILSPIDGIVAERLADPGDLASPGNILMKLFDPTRLMLNVPVREGLVTRIRVGAQVPFRVEALNTNLTGEVREVVPSVDPGSRTFLVKICIGETPALMPGMFGVIRLPTGSRQALVLPDSSVRRIGQLEYVGALLDGQVRPVLVRTIPAAPGRREVVSGLEAGMTVLAGP